MVSTNSKSPQSHVSAALDLIYSEYGKKIGDFIKKVIIHEKRRNGLPAEEVISLSYLVIKNCEDVFNDENGHFDNYVLRALHNELLRTKYSKYLLYADYEEKTGREFQVQDYDRAENPYVYSETLPPSTEDDLEKKEEERSLVALLAIVARELTPFEKSLIYYSFFLSTGTGKSALKPFCLKYGMSYYKSLASLKKSLVKIKGLLEKAELGSILSNIS